MFFTQEDYKKIEGWFKQHSKTDTDFDEVMLPLTGKELVVLVLDGKNKKIFLNDFIQEIKRLILL